MLGRTDGVKQAGLTLDSRAGGPNSVYRQLQAYISTHEAWVCLEGGDG